MPTPIPPGIDPRSEIIRNFDYDYIACDATMCFIWVCVLLRGGHRFPLCYAVVLGFFISAIDGYGPRSWFMTQAEGFPAGTNLREWVFTLSDGTVLTRADAPQPYNWFALSNTFVLMKHGADFMMLQSYALIFFAWWVVVTTAWRGPAPRSVALRRTVAPYTALFFCGMMAVPFFDRYVVHLSDARAWTVRHMSGDPSYTNGAIMWKSLTGVAAMVPVYLLRGDLLTVPYIFCTGLMQAFTMELPLFVFDIRPFDMEVLQYETLFLINQATAWTFMAIDVILPAVGIATDAEALAAYSVPRLMGLSLAALVSGGTASKFGTDLEQIFTGDAGAGWRMLGQHVVTLCVITAALKGIVAFCGGGAKPKRN